MQWKSMLIPEQTLTLPAPPKRPLPWLLLPCLIAEEPSPRCHLAARRGPPQRGLMLRCVEDWSILVHVRPTIPSCTAKILKEPHIMCHTFFGTQGVFPTPQCCLVSMCFLWIMTTLIIPKASFGCFPFGNHRLIVQTRNRKPRQVFLSASGLWLAVLFTLVIFLVAAMLARYVTSKGEKEQMENGESAPAAKEAPRMGLIIRSYIRKPVQWMFGVLALGVVVDDVVAVSAVLRMHDSRATTFGSRCFNKSVMFRIQICFWLQGPLFTVVPC